jgi:hypothetical protein
MLLATQDWAAGSLAKEGTSPFPTVTVTEMPAKMKKKKKFYHLCSQRRKRKKKTKQKYNMALPNSKSFFG